MGSLAWTRTPLLPWGAMRGRGCCQWVAVHEQDEVTTWRHCSSIECWLQRYRRWEGCERSASHAETRGAKG